MKLEKRDNNLAWGISLLFFGLLFLSKQMDFFPPEIADKLYDFKNYPLILGVIFLLTHKNKNIGIVLVVVAILFRISDIIQFTRQISDFVWPVLLIVAGLVLILNKRIFKK